MSLSKPELTQDQLTRLVGELVFALNEAATKIAGTNKGSQSGEFANLIRKGCHEFDRASIEETLCLEKFAIDTRNYWQSQQVSLNKGPGGYLDPMTVYGLSEFTGALAENTLAVHEAASLLAKIGAMSQEDWIVKLYKWAANKYRTIPAPDLVHILNLSLECRQRASMQIKQGVGDVAPEQTPNDGAKKEITNEEFWAGGAG
jgi:hypothetical protein